MRGTIIHYDPLTQCGLLRTDAGQLHYFRQDDIATPGESTPGTLTAGRYVALRVGVLADTGGSRMDVAEGLQAVREVEQARRVVGSPTLPVHTPRAGRFGWIGGWLAVGALLCLLLAGGDRVGYGGPNPKMIGSVFGVAAAVLLVLLAALFFKDTSARRQIRWAYWLAAWCSLFAYVSQTIFEGFEADAPAVGYGYTLIALFFAVYVIPYRRK